jgi:hypothetical protein
MEPLVSTPFLSQKDNSSGVIFNKSSSVSWSLGSKGNPFINSDCSLVKNALSLGLSTNKLSRTSCLKTTNRGSILLLKALTALAILYSPVIFGLFSISVESNI